MIIPAFSCLHSKIECNLPIVQVGSSRPTVRTSLRQWRCRAAETRDQPDIQLPFIDPKPFLDGKQQGGFKMTMGLTQLQWEDWIQIDDEYREDMAERRHLVAHERARVISCTPAGEEATRELLEKLAGYLPERHPSIFSRHGDMLRNAATGEAWDLSGCSGHPLDIMAQLVQEDLIILQQDSGGQLRFVSGAVLYPHKWDLREKIGHPLDIIHGPVPGYRSSLSRPVNAFMARLASRRPFCRANWTVCPYAVKFTPLCEDTKVEASELALPPDVKITAVNAREHLHTRVEWQTIFRLPKTEAVVFSVRTFVKPLRRLEASPSEAAHLAAALSEMPEQMLRYKGLTHTLTPMLQYLESISEGAIS